MINQVSLQPCFYTKYLPCLNVMSFSFGFHNQFLMNHINVNINCHLACSSIHTNYIILNAFFVKNDFQAHADINAVFCIRLQFFIVQTTVPDEG